MPAHVAQMLIDLLLLMALPLAACGVAGRLSYHTEVHMWGTKVLCCAIGCAVGSMLLRYIY